MTGRPEAEQEVGRWLREAQEELRVARYLSGAEELPARVTCFHSHIAAAPPAAELRGPHQASREKS
jgi:hypothetical protein